MFGYILAHWDERISGASLPIRFAVLERRETIGFVVDNLESAPGRTTIRMKPSNLLVRMAVAPTYFEFDTTTRKILGHDERRRRGPSHRVRGRGAGRGSWSHVIHEAGTPREGAGRTP